MTRAAVVLTGAAGGIGLAIAQQLTDDDYLVVALDREPGPELPGVRWIQGDLERLVGDAVARARLLRDIDAARAGLGADRIHALVNNAAWQCTGSAAGLEPEQFMRSLAINVAAPYLLAQMLYPALVEARGCIVNIGSVHARQTKSGFCAYSTSKAALAGLTRALAVEWGAMIRVSAIEPAAIATPMLEAGFAGDPQARARLAAAHPANEIGQPAQVARWVGHLLADTSQFANGTVINLDGGVSFRLHDPA
jgi:NAD(P)-dependent dehydrogenase (short-subunit alcohol dehydrogenase family)